MNYGELKDAVVLMSQRGDQTASMPTFLALAEQRIYIGEASTDPLRLGAMVKTATSAAGELPADYLEMKRVKGAVNSQAKTLNFFSSEEIGDATRGFSYEGQTIVVSDDVAMPLTLLYFARFPALVDDTDTNWLLTNAPAVYLAAMLIEVARVTVDPEMLGREAANFTSAANSIIEADARAQFSGSGLQMPVELGRVV